jgi:hypothetical protein
MYSLCPFGYLIALKKSQQVVDFNTKSSFIKKKKFKKQLSQISITDFLSHCEYTFKSFNH